MEHTDLFLRKFNFFSFFPPLQVRLERFSSIFKVCMCVCVSVRELAYAWVCVSVRELAYGVCKCERVSL
jgi:hypothetical protein